MFFLFNVPFYALPEAKARLLSHDLAASPSPHSYRDFLCGALHCWHHNTTLIFAFLIILTISSAEFQLAYRSLAKKDKGRRSSAHHGGIKAPPGIAPFHNIIGTYLCPSRSNGRRQQANCHTHLSPKTSLKRASISLGETPSWQSRKIGGCGTPLMCCRHQTVLIVKCKI